MNCFVLPYAALSNRRRLGLEALECNHVDAKLHAQMHATKQCLREML